MPSGYTAKIAEGITFREYAMGCARAFGALIMMRDDPADAKIPEEFKVDDYHHKKLAEAERNLQMYTAMSPWECDEQARQEFEADEKDHQKTLNEKRDLRAKYEAQLAEARAWVPPTKDHVGLKDFMVEQLVKSIEFDCDVTYYLEHAPAPATGEEWRKKKLAKAVKDIAYHKDELAKETKRNDERNAWVRELRKSLS